MLEEFIDQRIHLFLHLRLFRLAEKRLDDSPVIGVLRRIRFDRQLPHRTDVFLGRNGNAERRVVAEGLPIGGGGSNILISQNHGNLLALKGGFEHAFGLTLRAERVVGGEILIVHWHFPFGFRPTTGVGLLCDFLPAAQVCKSFFSVFFPIRPGCFSGDCSPSSIIVLFGTLFDPTRGHIFRRFHYFQAAPFTFPLP
ncbi:MAG: hypothetical protein ABSC62_09800 [Terracidiphilus sp.]